jgi:hypothetical protein
MKGELIELGDAEQCGLAQGTEGWGKAERIQLLGWPHDTACT